MTDPSSWPNTDRADGVALPDRPLLTKPPSYVGSMAAKPIPLPPQRDHAPPAGPLPSPSASGSFCSVSPPSLSPFQVRGSVGSLSSPPSSTSSSPSSSYFPGSTSSQNWCGGRTRSNSSPGSFPLRRASMLASSPLAGPQLPLGSVIESDSDDDEDTGAPFSLGDRHDGPATVRPPRHGGDRADLPTADDAHGHAAGAPRKRPHAPAKSLSISVPPPSPSYVYGYGSGFGPTSPPLGPGGGGGGGSACSPTSPLGNGGFYFARHSTGTGAFPLRRDSRPSPLANPVGLPPSSAPVSGRFPAASRDDNGGEGAADDDNTLGLGLGFLVPPTTPGRAAGA